MRPRSLRALSGDTRAQDLIEYSLVVGLLAISVAGTFPAIAAQLLNVFERISKYLSVVTG